MAQAVSGFSKKTKDEKISWLLENYLSDLPGARATLQQYWHPDTQLQQLHDDFIENSLSNFYLPFAIAPNFLINDELFAIPMVIEESSVVAAASNAAKFWLDKGGFSAEVIRMEKSGQIHINYHGDPATLSQFFETHRDLLVASIGDIQANMKKRGGGLQSLQLENKTENLAGYYQLHATFLTGDAMGANFINSCLEAIAQTFKQLAGSFAGFSQDSLPEVVMSILSNYVPNCLVKAEVSCDIENLTHPGMTGAEFAQRFVRAIQIAHADVKRAVTHNKGIMNGIDAVILATGNDFRAVEAGVHAYASKGGNYGSLTHAIIEGNRFRFWIEIPLALGTVGGLTSLHPLVKLALEILQKPNAAQLMKVVAVAGLAQNFAAIRSLVTVGIQKGHMKMHLMNILNQLNASSEEKSKAIAHFSEQAVSHNAVTQYVASLRS